MASYRFLEPRPRSVYRQLFIKNTGIRAEVIYRACTALDEFRVPDDDNPRTPDQVAQDYGLPLPAVLEAIEYCRTRPAEIATDYAREERLMEASGMKDPDYKLGGKFKVVPPEEIARILKS